MMTALRELDVRDVPPLRRHPQIFQTFDALSPGETFVLVNDHDPKPLLYQFQFEHAGEFDWSVLENGPERFRVEIRRRSGAPRGVNEYLSWDHRRLESILAAVELHVASAAFKEAGARFAEFSCGLNRHILMEERILFPAFEKSIGMRDGGPTMVMMVEHQEIKRLLGEVAAAIRDRAQHRFVTAADGLRSVLGEHNAKEEQILYPMSDQVAGGVRERDDLVKLMQSVSEEPSTACHADMADTAYRR